MEVPGVDLVALRGWMDGEGLGAGDLTDVGVLTGGTQNVLVRLTRDGRSYVLRRGPLHKRPDSDETIRRESRVVAALAGTDVPHPAFVRGCGDVDVIGAAFYLMDPVDGVNPTLGLPDGWAEPEAYALGLSLVDAAAAVGRVDHVAVGIGDLGHPDGFLERQVRRWHTHLAGYLAVPEYGTRPRIEGVQEVGGWLDAHRPTAWTPGLLHGDLHLANCMVDRHEPAVRALVDWEMSTVGDPLLDLGWLLATWPGPDAPSLVGSVALPGLPTPAEVVDRYADGSRRDLTHVRWYEVLACFKLGIVLEGTYVRALAGHAPLPVGEQLHETARRLLARASERTA